MLRPLWKSITKWITSDRKEKIFFIERKWRVCETIFKRNFRKMNSIDIYNAMMVQHNKRDLNSNFYHPKKGELNPKNFIFFFLEFSIDFPMNVDSLMIHTWSGYNCSISFNLNKNIFCKSPYWRKQYCESIENNKSVYLRLYEIGIFIFRINDNKLEGENKKKSPETREKLLLFWCSNQFRVITPAETQKN